jgi:hypothetical protein
MQSNSSGTRQRLFLEQMGDNAFSAILYSILNLLILDLDFSLKYLSLFKKNKKKME